MNQPKRLLRDQIGVCRYFNDWPIMQTSFYNRLAEHSLIRNRHAIALEWFSRFLTEKSSP